MVAAVTDGHLSLLLSILGAAATKAFTLVPGLPEGGKRIEFLDQAKKTCDLVVETALIVPLMTP